MPSAEIQAAGPVSSPPSATRPSPTATIRPSVSRVRPLVSSDRQPPFPSGRSIPMAPLGSPTKTTTSPPSTTGLPMIAPSAIPGSGDRLVPGRAVGAPCRPRRPGSDTEGDEAGPVGGHALRQPPLERLRSVRPGEAVVRRPGEGDVAGACPQDHGVLAGRRGLGDPAGAQDRIERRGLPAAGGIPDRDRGDRRVCAVAIAVAERQDAVAPGGRSPDRARGPGERLARPGRAAVTRCLGDAPFAGRSAGADRNDRARYRDDVGDRAETAGLGLVDQRPGEVRRGRRGGGRRRVARRGDGDRRR